MESPPELYDKSNNLQRQDSAYICQRLRQDEAGKSVGLLVDLGCGTGNITKDFFDSMKVDHAIGVDISESMIEFAKKTYGNQKIEFKVADICTDWDCLSSYTGIAAESVDIVTSSYCIHWVSDVKKAVDNIYKMLKPGGRCYIIMFSWSELLPLQEQITFHARWADTFRKHLSTGPEEKPAVTKVDKDSKMPIRSRRKSSAPFPVFEIPSAEARIQKWTDFCQNSGLEPVKVHVHDSTFTYEDSEAFRGELRSICHFLVYIPEEQRVEFMKDYFEHMDNCYIKRQESLPLVKCDYQFLSVVARKPLKTDAKSSNGSDQKPREKVIS